MVLLNMEGLRAFYRTYCRTISDTPWSTSTGGPKMFDAQVPLGVHGNPPMSMGDPWTQS